MSLDYGTLGALGIGLALSIGAVALVGSADAPLRAAWNRYVDFLRRQFDLLLIQSSAERAALLQFAAIVLQIVLALAAGLYAILFFVPLVAVMVPVYLLTRRAKRVGLIESQLDAWLRAVANSLKAAPSIGDALASSAALVPAPMSEEVDLVLKEMALGSSLDKALQQAATRIDSPVFSSAVTTLLIARKSGGNLPEVLEKAAGTLREMERLHGVVRTKTAEAKAQAYVLGALPFALAGFLHITDEQYFPNLVATPLGIGLLAGAIGLWLGSIGAALKILKVDI